MPDLIKLKSQEDALDHGLAPGEIAIDEATRVLLIDRGDSHDPEPIPLNVLALPEAVEIADYVVTITPDGPQHTRLSAGGGGRPFDAGTWRVPGVILMAREEIEIDGVLITHIDITEPCVIDAVAIDLPAYEGTLEFRMNAGATEIASTTFTHLTEPGAYTEMALQLQPGRYTFEIETDRPITFRALKGMRAWGMEIETFPIMFRIIT